MLVALGSCILNSRVFDTVADFVTVHTIDDEVFCENISELPPYIFR